MSNYLYSVCLISIRASKVEVRSVCLVSNATCLIRVNILLPKITFVNQSSSWGFGVLGFWGFG